jgi:hypothetical protein
LDKQYLPAWPSAPHLFHLPLFSWQDWSAPCHMTNSHILQSLWTVFKWWLKLPFWGLLLYRKSTYAINGHCLRVEEACYENRNNILT